MKLPQKVTNLQLLCSRHLSVDQPMREFIVKTDVCNNKSSQIKHQCDTCHYDVIRKKTNGS